MSLPNPLGIPPPPQKSVVFSNPLGIPPPPQQSVVFSNPLGLPLTFLNNPLSSRIRGQSLFPLKRIRQSSRQRSRQRVPKGIMAPVFQFGNHRQSLRRGLREREQSHPPVPASPSPLPHPLLCLPSQSASSSNPRSSTFLAAHTENMLPC